MGFLKDLTWLNWLKPLIHWKKITLRAWTPSVMKHQDFSHVSLLFAKDDEPPGTAYRPTSRPSHHIFHVLLQTCIQPQWHPNTSKASVGGIVPLCVGENTQRFKKPPARSSKIRTTIATISCFQIFLQWVFLKSDHEWPVSKIATTKAPCRRSSRALSLFSVESVFTCSSSWHILAQGQLYGQKHGDLKQVSVCLKRITLRNHHWICSLYTQHYLYYFYIYI